MLSPGVEMSSDNRLAHQTGHSDSRAAACVFAVEGDASARESLELLICGAGWQPRIFASPQELLAQPRTLVPSCLILDVRPPDFGGLELQTLLADRRELPIIFMTAHSDVRLSVKAMKAGAIEFLIKPVPPDALLNTIRYALDCSRTALIHYAEMRVLGSRYATLSPREREVMSLVAAGWLNKQIGGMLGISEITVKAHRGRVMRKMSARSIVGLINAAGRLGVVSATGH